MRRPKSVWRREIAIAEAKIPMKPAPNSIPAAHSTERVCNSYPLSSDHWLLTVDMPLQTKRSSVSHCFSISYRDDLRNLMILKSRNRGGAPGKPPSLDPAWYFHPTGLHRADRDEEMQDNEQILPNKLSYLILLLTK